MKHSLKVIVPVLLVILLAACSGNNTGKSNKAQDTTHHDQMAMETTTVPAADVKLKDDKLNAIYQYYVHLTTALTKGDVAEAKIASNAIEIGAKEIEGAGIVAANASTIMATSDLEAQRTAYATLSNAFIALIKKSGVSSGELYIDFCPMAINDKGAFWLSANKEIKNPYLGEEMMTCGEVKETLHQ